MRLVNQQSVDWQSRAHFFGLASNLMRRILVDHARARLASKRGGGVEAVSLDEITNPTEPEDSGAAAGPRYAEPRKVDGETDEDVAAIDEALTRPHGARRAAGEDRGDALLRGSHHRGDAQAMNISDATVKREWTLARAWLRRELSKGE